MDFHSLTQHSESLHDTSQSQLAAQHVDHTRNVDHTEPADHIQDMDEVQAANESSVTSLSIRDDVSSLSLQSSASLASSNLSSLASELSTRANQVSAVQESSSSHSSQTVVYCRTSENTATASTDTHCEHTPVTSHPARPPDFTSIEIPMRECPPELCQRHYDAVLISTTEDKHIATVFKYVLTEFITLEDGRHPEVCTLHSGSDFPHVQSIFQHMSEALKHSTYMFMIVTARFCTDSWAELQRDECLMESIKNPHKRWCVIPVLMQSANELPFGLRSLKGIGDILNSEAVSGSLAEHCASNKSWTPAKSDIDALFLENMTQLLNQRLHLKAQREQTQRKKLKQWILKEQMERYVARDTEKIAAEDERRRLERCCEQQLTAQRQQLGATQFTQGDRPLSVSYQTVEPVASSSSSSSSSSSQLIQPIHIHVEMPACPRPASSFVFNGPLYNAQIGDHNVMRHCTDSQRASVPVSTADLSVVSDEPHLQSLSSNDSYEVRLDTAPASLPTSTEPSCDDASATDDDTMTLLTRHPPLTTSDRPAECSVSHVTAPTNQRPPTDTAASRPISVECSADVNNSHLPVSPVNDGLQLSSTGRQCAVITPFTVEPQLRQTGHVTRLSSCDDDDQTNPKQVVAAAAGHCADSETDEDDTAVKRVTETSDTACVTSSTVDDVSRDVTRTSPEESRDSRHPASVNSRPSISRDQSQAAESSGSVRADHTRRSAASRDLSINRDLDESLSSIMMPQCEADTSVPTGARVHPKCVIM